MTNPPESFCWNDLPRVAAQVRVLARRVVVDTNRADDLAQDVWVHELDRDRRGQDRDRERGPGFLVGMLRNLARKQRRGDQRRARRESRVAADLHEAAAPPADEAVLHAETLQQIVAAALALEEPYRSTILLRYLQDLPTEEVARVMDVPTSTVRVRTKRAIERLRERLRQSLGAGFLVALGDFAHHGMPAPVSSPVETVADSGSSSLLESTKTHGAISGGRTMLDSQVWKAAAIGALAVATSVGALHLFGMDLGSGLGRGGSSGVASSAAPQEPGRRMDRTVVESKTQRADTPTITRVTSSSLGGRVVDPSGAPVANANVRIWNRGFVGAGRYRDGDRAQAPSATETGTTGEFSVAGRSPERRFGVSVRAPGFAVTATDYQPSRRDDIVLYPSTSLRGTVRDAATGHAIQGVLVRIFDLAFDGDRLDLVRTATTDKDGRYRLDGVAAARRMQVEFAAPGGLSVYQTLNLAVADHNAYDLELDRSPTIDVVVMDGTTERPVAGATVFATGRRSRALGATGADGRLRVVAPKSSVGSTPAYSREVRPGVFAEAPGYGRTARSVGASGELEIRLVPAGRLRGIVRDAATGEVVVGAAVSWASPPLVFVKPRGSGGVAGDSLEATTDKSGQFILPHVPPAGRVVEGELQVWRDGRVAYLHDVLPASAGEERLVEVALGVSRTVRGRVLVNGRPSTGWVVLESDGGAKASRKESAMTTASGQFEFANLSPGRYRLSARAVDATAEVVVDLGAQDVEDVELNVAVAAGHIHGTVLTDEGLPVAGATVLAVMMHEDGREIAEGETIETPDDFAVETAELSGGFAIGGMIDAVGTVDENGQFAVVLPSNPRARYRLGVYQGGFGVVVRDVPQGAHGIEFRVPRLAKVRLSLSDSKTGEPVRRAGIKWTGAGRAVTLAWRRSFETVEGVLALELPIGSVQLTLRDSDRDVVREITVEVPEGGLRDAIPVVF